MSASDNRHRCSASRRVESQVAAERKQSLCTNTSSCVVNINYNDKNEKITFEVYKNSAKYNSVFKKQVVLDESALRRIEKNSIDTPLSYEGKLSFKLKIIKISKHIYILEQLKSTNENSYSMQTQNFMSKCSIKDNFPVSRFKFPLPRSQPNTNCDFCCLSYDGTLWDHKKRRGKTRTRDHSSERSKNKTDSLENVKENKEKNLKIVLSPKKSKNDLSKYEKKKRRIIVTSDTLDLSKKPKVKNKRVQTDFKNLQIETMQGSELLPIFHEKFLSKKPEKKNSNIKSELASPKIDKEVSLTIEGNKKPVTSSSRRIKHRYEGKFNLSKKNFTLVEIGSDDSCKPEIKPKLPQRRITDMEYVEILESCKKHPVEQQKIAPRPQIPRKFITKETIADEIKCEEKKPQIPRKKLNTEIETLPLVHSNTKIYNEQQNVEVHKLLLFNNLNPQKEEINGILQELLSKNLEKFIKTPRQRTEIQEIFDNKNSLDLNDNCLEYLNALKRTILKEQQKEERKKCNSPKLKKSPRKELDPTLDVTVRPFIKTVNNTGELQMKLETIREQKQKLIKPKEELLNKTSEHKNFKMLRSQTFPTINIANPKPSKLPIAKKEDFNKNNEPFSKNETKVDFLKSSKSTLLNSVQDSYRTDFTRSRKNISTAGSIYNSTLLFTKVNKDQSKDSSFKRRKEYYRTWKEKQRRQLDDCEFLQHRTVETKCKKKIVLHCDQE